MSNRQDDIATLKAAIAILSRVDRREPWHRCTCGHDRDGHVAGMCWGYGHCDCRRFHLDGRDALGPETARVLDRLHEVIRQLQ